MKIKLSIFLLVSILYSTFLLSQTPGLIYKPASTALGRSVLDPNGDGYSSLTTSGFSGTDYGTASELKLIPLPAVSGEPVDDLSTGSNGGHTDIASVGNNSNQSCYVMYKNVNGINYLILRFRIGGASTAPKGYSFLMDTDGVFGTVGTNGNPGFDKEVVLQTGSGGVVAVYSHTPTTTNPNADATFPVDEYSQRSIALSNNSGDSDYFYDFFIPYSVLGLTNEPVRIAAATITSAGSGISGSKSDFNGINDKLYGNDPLAISKALVLTFPATPLTSLIEGYTYASPQSITPILNGDIKTSTTSISGTSLEANGTTITIYKNGVSIGTTTVSNSTWTLTGVSGLTAGNLITATATASGKTDSSISSAIEVTDVPPCFTPIPTALARPGSNVISGLYAQVGGASIVGSTVRIRIYEQTNSGTVVSFTEINSSSTIYVLTDGTWTFPTGLNSNIFNTTTIVATATYNTCTSAYSDVSKKSSGQVGITTVSPTIDTLTLLASASVQRSVIVTNKDLTDAVLILYRNGLEIGRSPGLVARAATAGAAGGSATINYTGYVEGDSLYARAQSSTVDYWISNISNSLVVTASSTPSSIPTISGTYINGATTVSGTSAEAAGTVIYIYNGATLLGTTTVTAYGTWSLSGLTLATGNVLTTTAKATGKTISSSSASVTVQAGAPAAPTITLTYQAGATSITGSGGVGTVTVYVDGSPIGTTAQTGAWTLSGFSSIQLYKGAKITATNTSSGIESILSNQIVVTGVNSFLITNTTDGAIATQTAGTAFNIKIVAKDNVTVNGNGTGNTVTTFTSAVVLSSSSNIASGGGKTSNFIAGILNPQNLNLTTSGSKTITVVNVDDPTAFGTANVTIIPAGTGKFTLSAPSDIVAGTRTAYTVTRSDVYDNLVTSGAQTIYLFANGTTGSFYDAATSGSILTSITILDGQSSASFWFTATLANNYSVTTSEATPANGSTAILDATDSIGVTSSAASGYLVTTSSVSVNQSSTVTISAQLVDVYNNPVTTSGLTVNWTATNGGSFSAPTSTTNTSGIATITYTVSSTIGATHNVTATTGSNTGQSSTITVTPTPPSITSFSPSSACPGDTITITGTNLSLVSSVSFGSTLASSFNIIDSTTITALVGFGNSGNVSVTNSGGTSSLAGFTHNSTTWNGTSWSNGAPTGSNAIIFAANYTIASDLSGCALQVTNNAVVTVSPSFDVTLSGAIVVDPGSSFNLNSNSNLIQITSAINSGNIIVNRETSLLKRLDYALWSSPVVSQNLLNFSPETLTNRFYTYNSGTDQYNAIASPSTTNFSIGTGYLIRMPNTHPTTPTLFGGTFTGVPFNGTVTLPVTSNTYNAIGNPYPSTISADLFISSNSITEPLYFWRKTNNSANPSYATYTKAGGTGTTAANLGGLSNTVPNGTIQVGQGFIVKSVSTSLVFNNTMRIGDNTNQFLRSSLSEKNRIWLNLTDNNGYFCQTMFGYMSGATKEIDPTIDGRYINDVQTALTSIINNEEFAIQGKGLPFINSDTVQLGFKTTTAGSYSISLDHFDGLFSSGQNIFIKDNLTTTIHDLRTGSYTFSSEIGVFNTRFQIVYLNSVLNTNLPEFNSNTVIVYKSNQKIVINTSSFLMSNVKLYDVRGRLINEKKNINANEIIMDAPSGTEMLFVKITSQNDVVITKKIIL